jgi:hypothetical protein
MATSEEQVTRRTPFSVKLPQVALDESLEPVRALADLGAPATPHVIAQHAETSYSSSAFKTKLAAAGYYGLIRKDGDKRALTERGTTILGDGDEATRARREAVMSTSFGPLIHSLRGRAVSETAVALRLQNDYRVPEGSAPSVADALIDAATQAGLIQDGRFDAVAIEEAESVLPSETAAATTGDGATPTRAITSPRQPEAMPARKPATPPAPEVKQRIPFARGVQVVVKIDASSLTPQQIAELVRELGRPSET